MILIHCETGTGVLNPLEAVGAVCERHARGLIVDAMSSFGALPIDARTTRFDALVAASGKCLEGVPGMGFVLLRKAIVDGCAGRSQSLAMDLHDQHVYMERTGQWRFTPPTHVVVALGEALAQFIEEGGQPARLARYSDNCRTLVDGLRTLGLEPFLRPEVQAPIIVTFHAPIDAAYDFQRFYAAAKSRGFVLYPGKLTQLETFRVGLHRRDRAQRDGAGGARGGRLAARHGNQEHRMNTKTKAMHEHPAVAAVRKAEPTKVKVAVSDIDGILRGKYLHPDKFYGAVQPPPAGGFGFCDVVFGWDSQDHTYDNTQVTGWQHGFPDAMVRLDLDTARHVPWDGNVPFFLGEFINADGSPYPICPRQTLKRVLKRAEKLGVMPMTGMEFEWFNFAETPKSWADKKGAAADDADERHVRLLAAAHEREPRVLQRADGRDGGVQRAVRGAAHRDRPGRLRGRDPVQRRARAGRPRDPVQDRREGDRAPLRHHAELHGEVERVVSRAAADTSTRACRTARRNLFYDAKSPRHMSKVFESYLAGQLACLLEFAPMYWPTINSYKRLVDGFWAPVKPTWGIDNRTASYRVIAPGPKSTRLETRCPGADVNPYLAMAALLAAGLHGVEKELKLTRAADHRHQRRLGKHPARAAHPDRDDAHLQPVGDRARLARRHLRRSLRRHA